MLLLYSGVVFPFVVFVGVIAVAFRLLVGVAALLGVAVVFGVVFPFVVFVGVIAVAFRLLVGVAALVGVAVVFGLLFHLSYLLVLLL